MLHPCFVCVTRGWCYTQVLNCCQLLSQNNVLAAGMGVGSVSAPGARHLNLWNWKRDKESAMPLSVPRMCCSVSVKLCVAAVKNNLLMRCMRAGCLQHARYRPLRGCHNGPTAFSDSTGNPRSVLLSRLQRVLSTECRTSVVCGTMIH